jgi:hypothetical protein
MPDMIRRLSSVVRAKLLRLVLTVFVALPVASGLSVSHAIPASASVCYYGPWTYDTISYSPTYGASFFSEVKYLVGYSCAGYKDSYYIDWFYDSMTFTNSEAYTYHGTTQGAACYWFDPSTWYCALSWGPDNTHYYCKANCTVYRVEFPQRWFDYDSRATVYSHWIGINTLGNLNFSDYHRFLLHQQYHDYCC